jgi:hypothetical protein
MPVILDLVYREFCRARLAEMRRQLSLWPVSPVVPEKIHKGRHPDGAGDTDMGSESLQERHLFGKRKRFLSFAKSTKGWRASFGASPPNTPMSELHRLRQLLAQLRRPLYRGDPDMPRRSE